MVPARGTSNMKLHLFITNHLAEILAEWTAFARKTDPAGTMSDLALRDDAADILQVIAADIETRQSPSAQIEKSQGDAPVAPGSQETAAAIHGRLRHASNFTLLELSAEFRALRATVLRMWLPRIGAMTDATVYEMVRFNEAIDQALAESIVTYSERADQTRELFLAILGHDLRAPLATVSLAADLMIHQQQPTDPAAGNLRRIKRSSRLMASMVDDLLGFARTRMGKGMPMHAEHIDIVGACRAAVEDASAMFPGCDIHANFCDDSSGFFDRVRIQQMVTNLLINAAQHGAQDKPIELSVTGDTTQLVIAVKNFGAVISAADLGTMFEPLVQLENGDTERVTLRTSLGLGLFIASETAIAHGGEISATSTEHDGTVMTVRLPRQPGI